MSSYPHHLSHRPMSASLSESPYRMPSRGPMILESGRPRSQNAMPGASAGTLLDNNDDLLSTIQGLSTRPPSSLGRYELYSQLSLSGGPINSSVSGNPLLSFFEKLNPSAQLTSHTLDTRLQKLIKLEKKVMKQQQELIKDINSWCNILPNDDCKRLLYHFIKFLEVEFDVNDQAIKKQSQIIGQLGNVNKREKRTNDLRWKRNKILAKLRESENKVGDSPVTLLTKENLEELECSVEIVEDQFVRSVNTGLKNSFVDYMMTMRNSGVKFKDSSNYFLDHYNFASKGEQSASSLQKLILQNKYNSILTGGLPSAGPTRDLMSSMGYGYDKGDNGGTENLDTLKEEEGEEGSQKHKGPVSAPTVLKALNDRDGTVSKSGQDSTHSNDPNEHSPDSFNIINSYSTPGSLGMIPGGSHLWG